MVGSEVAGVEITIAMMMMRTMWSSGGSQSGGGSHADNMFPVALLLLLLPAQVPATHTQCPHPASCAAPATCAPHYLSLLLEPASYCLLAASTPGVCCPPSAQSCE